MIVTGGIGSGGISTAGPAVEGQLGVWLSNPWGYDTAAVQYPGSKYKQYENIVELQLDNPVLMTCYSAGAESCLQYASSNSSIETVILLEPTFTGADEADGNDIGFEGWSAYMEQVLMNGTNVIIYDDRIPNLGKYRNVLNKVAQLGDDPSTGDLVYIMGLTNHVGEPGLLGEFSTNTSQSVRNSIYRITDRIGKERGDE